MATSKITRKLSGFAGIDWQRRGPYQITPESTQTYIDLGIVTETGIYLIVLGDFGIRNNPDIYSMYIVIYDSNHTADIRGITSIHEANGSLGVIITHSDDNGWGIVKQTRQSSVFTNPLTVTAITAKLA